MVARGKKQIVLRVNQSSQNIMGSIRLTIEIN